MKQSFSAGLQDKLASATEAARVAGHSEVLPEHLLAALRCDLWIFADMTCEGVSDCEIERDLKSWLACLPAAVAPGRAPPPFSDELVTLLRKASADAGDVPAHPGHAFIALWSLNSSHAVAVMEKAGLNRYDMISKVRGGSFAIHVDYVHEVPQAGRKPLSGSQRELVGAGGLDPVTSQGGVWGASARSGRSRQKEPELANGPPSALRRWCRDLNAVARAGGGQLIGREVELSRMSRVLVRRTKSNLVLVGDPGVGKTALGEGFARRVIEGRVPPRLLRASAWQLDMGLLLGGTRYRGDFEERLKAVIAEVSALPMGILFVDEIHSLLGTGEARGAVGAADLLKPALASGELRCVGTTTRREYRRIFERDEALSRRFAMVEVPEPTAEDAERMLSVHINGISSHHGIAFEPGAAALAVKLSVRYIGARRLPDKAIDILEEAASAAAARGTNVTARHLEAAVADISRIPPASVSTDDRAALNGLPDRLKGVAFGADKATETMAQAIHVARAGLREPNRPVACLLLTGPSGVGKTIASRELAAALGLELIRFDMSEYMERHSVSRLIGAPPGYVGHDKGGLLTDAVDQKPHSVLLLDEIEKAHPDLVDILLQVMDHGTLTDADGRKVDFRHVIIVMTSNVGSALAERGGFGFGAADGGDQESALKTAFSAEFRGRLDAVIPFPALSRETMLRIVDRETDVVVGMAAAQGVVLEVDADARRWLADAAFGSGRHARDLQKLVTESLKAPLAREMLFGRLKDGGPARVRVASGGLLVEPLAGPAVPAD